MNNDDNNYNIIQHYTTLYNIIHHNIQQDINNSNIIYITTKFTKHKIEKNTNCIIIKKVFNKHK